MENQTPHKVLKTTGHMTKKFQPPQEGKKIICSVNNDSEKPRNAHSLFSGHGNFTRISDL